MEEQEQQLVNRARAGSRDALENLIAGVQDKVFGLAMRMLANPQDAEDATQEVIIRVITHLSQFRGESAFSSWVFRIAANYFIGVRQKTGMEQMGISFEQFGAELTSSVSALNDGWPGPEANLLEEDLKIGCSSAMLMCLDRPQRMAFILGKILEMPSREASEVLEIPDATYRKRLSRAHQRLQSFMRGHCGLVNPENPCRCKRRVTFAVKMGRVDPKKPIYASMSGARDMRYAREEVEKMDELQRTVAVYRSHPQYQAPETFQSFLKELINSPRYGGIDV